jgi:hypothetical protein
MPKLVQLRLPGSHGLGFGLEIPAPNSIRQRLTSIKNLPNPGVWPFTATHCDQIKSLPYDQFNRSPKNRQGSPSLTGRSRLGRFFLHVRNTPRTQSLTGWWRGTACIMVTARRLSNGAKAIDLAPLRRGFFVSYGSRGKPQSPKSASPGPPPKGEVHVTPGSDRPAQRSMCGSSCKTTFSNELWISRWPL